MPTPALPDHQHSPAPSDTSAADAMGANAASRVDQAKRADAHKRKAAAEATPDHPDAPADHKPG